MFEGKIENSNKEFIILLITNRIKKLLDNKNYNNIQDFININPDIDKFLVNNNLKKIVDNNGYKISNIEYLEILKSLLPQYENGVIDKATYSSNDRSTNKHSIVNTPQEKKLIKKNNTGFMDALLLAFITGAFIGTAFINIYTKVLQIM